jgi:hypothetical protein
MKGLTVILFLTSTTGLLGQDTEIISKGDSVIIRAYNITTDPFMFGDNSLTYLKKMNPRPTTTTFLNRHVDNKVDTVFIFNVGQDKFSVYQWDKDENALIDATLTTDKFKTKHGLQIGLRKKEVINRLSQYGLKSIPGYLILEDAEVYELLILIFKGDSLARITFQGYVD